MRSGFSFEVEGDLLSRWAVHSVLNNAAGQTVMYDFMQ